jgi:hypothetical protein
VPQCGTLPLPYHLRATLPAHHPNNNFVRVPGGDSNKTRASCRIALQVVQRNLRKYMQLRLWPWWKLWQKVKPMLNVTRIEDEMKVRTDLFLACNIIIISFVAIQKFPTYLAYGHIHFFLGGAKLYMKLTPPIFLPLAYE